MALLFVIAVVSGALASMIGLGGGSILMPILTIYLGVNFQHAAAAALSSVLAGSIGALLSNFRCEPINIRLVVLLSLMAGAGAVLGSILSSGIETRYLYLFFGIAEFVSLIILSLPPKDWSEQPVDRVSKWLRLDCAYTHHETQCLKRYHVRNVLIGAPLITAIGLFSGMLGLGGGGLLVTTLHRTMNIPLRPSIMTCCMIMGVMSIVSVEAFRESGHLVPSLVIPIALGALIGAAIGGRLAKRLHPLLIRRGLQVSLALISVRMAAKFFSH